MEKRLKPIRKFQYCFFPDGEAPVKVLRSRLFQWLEHTYDNPGEILSNAEKVASKVGMIGTITLRSGFVEIKFLRQKRARG